jgi:hypothetical protein
MTIACRLCGAENEVDAKFCGRCGKPLGEYGDYRAKDMRALSGEEKVLWDNGEVQLTTEAVLIGMNSDSPDVLPLDAIYELETEENCLVFKVKDGDDHYCSLDNPRELEILVEEQIAKRRRLLSGDWMVEPHPEH